MMRKPTNEDTMDMKIDRGSMTRTKSSPRTKACRATNSPPPRANGMSVRGSTTVTAPRRTDQAERAARETGRRGEWSGTPGSGQEPLGV